MTTRYEYETEYARADKPLEMLVKRRDSEGWDLVSCSLDEVGDWYAWFRRPVKLEIPPAETPSYLQVLSKRVMTREHFDALLLYIDAAVEYGIGCHDRDQHDAAVCLDDYYSARADLFEAFGFDEFKR